MKIFFIFLSSKLGVRGGGKHPPPSLNHVFQKQCYPLFLKGFLYGLSPPVPDQEIWSGGNRDILVQGFTGLCMGCPPPHCLWPSLLQDFGGGKMESPWYKALMACLQVVPRRIICGLPSLSCSMILELGKWN